VSRLGYLGPAIVVVGAAVAGLGAWYAIHARPQPGDTIDRLDLDQGQTLVVRAEVGGQRAFLELHGRDRLLWQALIPRYAGTSRQPGIAWGATAVTARVERTGRAEVFALARRDGQKLGGFRLAPEHEPIANQPTGPLTLTDHLRSYEIVGGSDWHQIIGVDLQTGQGIWKADLGPAPITGGGVNGNEVWLAQGSQRRTFNAVTGIERR